MPIPQLTTMKTAIRFLVVSIFLATVSSVSAAVETSAPMSPTLQGRTGSTQVIVSHKNVLSASELAKYQQLEQAAKAKTEKQSAGEGMDKSTMIIIAVVAVVVVVAVASGGGGGMGRGY